MCVKLECHSLGPPGGWLEASFGRRRSAGQTQAKLERQAVHTHVLSSKKELANLYTCSNEGGTHQPGRPSSRHSGSSHGRLHHNVSICHQSIILSISYLYIYIYVLLYKYLFTSSTSRKPPTIFLPTRAAPGPLAATKRSRALPLVASSSHQKTAFCTTKEHDL